LVASTRKTVLPTLKRCRRGLAAFLGAALAPSLAHASISIPGARLDDRPALELPSALAALEQRAERPPCVAFCGTVELSLKSDGIFGGGGSVVSQDAWGNHRFPAELDASKNRFGFTGYELDKETGLYNAKARYFDPNFGRFLTQDSYLGQIDNPPSLHRYFYANANPTAYVDLTGHASVLASAYVAVVDTFQFARGFSTSVLNNFALVPRWESNSKAFRRGELAGDVWSVVVGAAEGGAGLATAATGGTLTVASVGTASPITVPVTVVGGLVAIHGGQAAVRAGLHMSKAKESGSGVVSENTPAKNDTAPSKMEPAKAGDAGGAKAAADRKVPNPDGSKGKADHQAATKKLVEDLQAKYPPEEGFEIRSNQSIKAETGLDRRPDGAAVKDNKVVEVGEVARTRADNETLVTREQVKQQQYKEAGIPSTVVKLPSKPRPAPTPSPLPSVAPSLKPEEP
jgi:RHS repeat-associated protein